MPQTIVVGFLAWAAVSFPGCLDDVPASEQATTLLGLMEGTGKTEIDRNELVLRSGDWRLKGVEHVAPLVQIWLGGGNLIIEQSNLTLNGITVEGRADSNLGVFSSTLRLVRLVASDNSTVTLEHAMVTTPTEYGGLSFRAEALHLRHSTLDRTGAFSVQFADAPVESQIRSALRGGATIAMPQPIDLSGVDFDMAKVEISLEFGGGPHPMPLKFPLRELHGTVDALEIRSQKGMSAVIDIDSFRMRTHDGSVTPVLVSGWVEFTGSRPLPFTQCPAPCLTQELRPDTVFGPPEAIACQPPQWEASTGRLMSLVGHGHWLMVDWELPFAESAGGFGLQVTAMLEGGSRFVTLAGKAAWSNALLEFQVPLLNAICLDDRPQPTQATAYEVKLWIAQGGSGAGGCVRAGPDAEQVTVVPHFYGREEDEDFFLGLPCPTEPLPHA